VKNQKSKIIFRKQFMNKLFIIGPLAIGCFIFISMTIPYSEIQDPWEVPEEYENMINPYFGVKDKENLGRMLYLKHCKSCHGNKGKGDGPKAISMDLNVADFTSEAVSGQTDGTLYYKMTTGRNDMPAFKKRIKDLKEQWFIINYIRGLKE
jgi:hypothetical protein